MQKGLGVVLRPPMAAGLSLALLFCLVLNCGWARGGCDLLPESCACNCTTMQHSAASCWQPNGTESECDCVTGKGCWSKPEIPGPTKPSCPPISLRVCIAARSGHKGALIPLGSICAPRCPAGFINTSVSFTTQRTSLQHSCTLSERETLGAFEV